MKEVRAGAAALTPGVWRLHIPIPGNPLPYVAVHLLETPEGPVLVDAGWNAPESLAALEAGLAELGATLGDVRGLLVTHIHPDHYGLAGRIREESGAWVAMHADEAVLIRTRYVEVDHILGEVEEWLRQAGAAPDAVEELRDAVLDFRRYVLVTPPTILLEDGERAPLKGHDLVALHTPGHSPGHLCFLHQESELLLSGDHVLPRITPNVGLHPQSGPDPLGDFLTALARLRPFAHMRVSPSHGDPFTPLGERLEALTSHHAERLNETATVVARGAETVWEVASHLTWSVPWDDLRRFARRAALGEAHAHLAYLERRGELERLPGSPLRWRIAASASDGAHPGRAQAFGRRE